MSFHMICPLADSSYEISSLISSLILLLKSTTFENVVYLQIFRGALRIRLTITSQSKFLFVFVCLI